MMKYLPFIITFFFLTSCGDDGETVYRSDYSGNGNYIGSFSFLMADGTRYTAIVGEDEILMTLPKDAGLEGITPEYELYENATIQPNPNDIPDWTQEYRFMVTSWSGENHVYNYRINFVESKNPQNVMLSTQEEVDAFGKSGQTYISGNLIIGMDIDDYDIYDKIYPDNFPYITSIQALEKIEKVDGELIMKPGYIGENLSGLSSLKEIGGLRIEGDASLLKSGYFPKLEKIIYGISCEGLTNLQDLDFPVLQYVGGNIRFLTADLQLLKMPLLKEIKGDLSLKGDLYKDPGGFPTVNPITAFTFPALEKVRSISVTNFGMMSELSFPVLTTVSNINVYSNDMLLKLSFPSLASVFDIDMQRNSKLSDYSTFGPILPSLEERHWVVKYNRYNPTYQNMLDGKYKN